MRKVAGSYDGAAALSELQTSSWIVMALLRCVFARPKMVNIASRKSQRMCASE